MLSTRSQILEAATRLFARQGFQQTSVREIAEQLGLTKTAVLYHFPAKADILGALAEPFLDDFQAAVEQPGTRWDILERVLDVFLKHRYVLRNNLVSDMALAAQDAVIRRYPQLMIAANMAVMGPEADLRERIRTAQAIAMLSDPVIAYADEPVDQLREEVLRGVRLLYPEMP